MGGGGHTSQRHGPVRRQAACGAVVGADSAGKNAWGGLCAEKGHAQHVAFLLYALKQKLGVSNGFSTTLVLNHVHAFEAGQRSHDRHVHTEIVARATRLRRRA